VATRGVCVTHVCHVVRLFPLQGVNRSLFSNEVMQLHYVFYENYEDDIDYFVVKA
jgi:hypothetical protein